MTEVESVWTQIFEASLLHGMGAFQASKKADKHLHMIMLNRTQEILEGPVMEKRVKHGNRSR